LYHIETLNTQTEDAVTNDETEKFTKSTPSLLLSNQKIEQLLNDLDIFEQRTDFLNPSMSLSMLAAQLQTNTKYLSHIINNYKNADFNGYINRLRINYILLKLKEDPSYATYKISYLAETCGFSSHSVFSSVFKQVLGISPSYFIAQLRADMEQTQAVQ